MKPGVTVGLTCLLLLGASSAALAEGYGKGKVGLQAVDPYGEYLTDGNGRALYIFEEDKPGQSTCYDACAEVWPPFLTTGEPQAENVKDSLVGVIKRDDGKLQIAYNEMPLYYYVKDEGPGSTQGHDVHDKFGEWYLIAPSGDKVAGK
jgi:predicted lipoprotein with Yx(FWY)xxD motif